MRRPSYLIVGAVTALLVAGGVVMLVNREPPQALKDLERAKTASERAGEERDRIIANLDRIRENLAEGAGLSEKTAAIDRLTRRQVESLTELESLLRDQLEVLNRTQGALSSTSRAAAAVAKLGEEQVALLKRTIAALTELRGHARTATEISRLFAQRALYGAKLAEDSRKAFERP
jgi:hypothetical protein